MRAASALPPSVGGEAPGADSCVPAHTTGPAELTHNDADLAGGAAGVRGIGKSALVMRFAGVCSGPRSDLIERPAAFSASCSDGRSRVGEVTRRRTAPVPAGSSRPGTHRRTPAGAAVV